MIVNGISKGKFEPLTKKDGGWYKTSTCMGFECPLDHNGRLHLLWDFNAEHWHYKENYIDIWSDVFSFSSSWISDIKIHEGSLLISYADPRNHEGPNGHILIRITDNT